LSVRLREAVLAAAATRPPSEGSLNTDAQPFLVGLRRSFTVVLLCVSLCVATLAAAATRVDPALRFRQLTTGHFVIYFHQGEDRLAQRLARIAEDTWEVLRIRLGHEPPRRTHVVLADQTELANGWATPLPYPTILLAASWPQGSEFIGNTDDWLRLVFIHEFTHIVHLDRSRGWARAVRSVFGRVPVAFPNLFLPTWQIEGMATYFESAISGRGRLYAPDFREVERAPAREGLLFPLDRANGGLTAWPAGLAPYAYGLGFHQYLSDRFGADRLTLLSERTAGRVPYTASRSFRAIFGASLGTLWSDYQRQLRDKATAAAPPVDGSRQLTHDGFTVLGPRFAPPACKGCDQEIVYSARSPHGFPELKAIRIDGAEPRALTSRYLGSTSAVTEDAVIFDQQELRRNVGLYSDLYRLDRRSGNVRAMTHEARLLDPDLSPDRRTIAAVREGGGQRDLVLVALDDRSRAGAVTTLRAAADTQFATPRWSPDGRSVAVERHRLGRGSEVVIVDATTGAVRVVATGATRAVTPAWRPDGRAIVAAVDSEDQAFRVWEFLLDGDLARRPLTGREALWPDVSADGSTIVFVGYSDRGFDLFTTAYPQSSAAEDFVSTRPATPSLLHSTGRDSPPARWPPQSELSSRPFRPWPTLVPTSWSPIYLSDADQWRVGVATGGLDVLGYHAYAASATWRLSGADAFDVPARREPDWDVSYAYDRWRPRLFLSLSKATSFLRSTASGDSGSATLRAGVMEAGILLPFTRVRLAHQLLASALRRTTTYADSDSRQLQRRVAVRAGWSMRTARSYGYSISPEHGVAAGATAETSGVGPGSLGDTTTLTTDLRAYLPGLATHHVMALRSAAGVSTGARDVSRLFRLGGAAGNVATLDFGRRAVSLLRGFAPDSFAGSRVAVVNLDYRLPLGRVERGVGTWPVFMHTVHGAFFADAGHAWTQRFRKADVKIALGAELSANVVAGYSLPLTLTVGAAWGRDGAGGVATGVVSYVRVGRAF
jgi:hypothetical protein